MQHLHDDALALLALGEDPTTEETAHLEHCGQCAGEITAYGRVVKAGRSAAEAGSVPPPTVWAGIHEALGLAPSLRKDPLEDRQEQRTSQGSVSPPGPAGAALPVSLADERRKRRGTKWFAAAAAAVVVAGAATWGIVRGFEPQPEVLASVSLEPLPSYSDEGTATVDLLPDGERELVITSSSSDAEGYREVWLISPDITSMVSLGEMDGTEARLKIPDGLDLSAYPIVDISDEPNDGNPEHSGKSILRGQLEL
ncbi:anti-sigma factor [Arthrobacter gandavensis]|uniref:anti-sigma factor n=1 Tax=Arthrobacter gandavensis TaxID=169960 RepID=UPI00188ECA53|nr:anti-sigma factor [Arthrobacter gandavensis]MBF4995440.1 anti-sigma factor [Arthrobacter gandavensis]